jgi:diaminopimelate epimerase
MSYVFYKYQGTGNDFVMIDNREGLFDPENLDLVRKMCDRKFGVGSDGLMLIQDHEEADFELLYFNSDGSKSLCGNGSRCAVLFAKYLGIIKNETSFLAIDGIHHAWIIGNQVHLQMNDVESVEAGPDYFYLNTGSPHFIKFVNSVTEVDVVGEGKRIRYNDRFAEKGTNVNFLETHDDRIYVRTYERGVEDETLSCGTGVTACALVAGLKGFKSPVTIRTKGGNLQVSFEKKKNGFTNIKLIGPAEYIFKGEWPSK